MDPCRSGADCGHGCRRGETEVVVAVEVDRDRRAGQLDGPTDELGHRLGRRDPERVDDTELARTCLDRACVDALVEVRICTRRIDADEGGVDSMLRGERHRRGDPAEHLLARNADRVELEVGDRRLDHGCTDAELDQRLEVGGHRPRKAPDLGAQAGAGDQLHGIPIVL